MSAFVVITVLSESDRSTLFSISGSYVLIAVFQSAVGDDRISSDAEFVNRPIVVIFPRVKTLNQPFDSSSS